MRVARGRAHPSCAPNSVSRRARTPRPLARLVPIDASRPPLGGAATAELDDEDALQDFLGWLTANGVTGLDGPRPTAGMYATPAERGVLAATDVAAGTPVLTVPLKLALLDEGALEGGGHAAAGGGRGGLGWAARLALRLLREAAAGQASPWAPWLRVLPSDVGCAFSATAGPLLVAASALLPCPAARAALAAGPAALQSEWEAVQAAGLAPPGTDAAAWSWARSVVQSRTAGLPVAGGGGGGGGGGAGDGHAPPPAATIVRGLVPLFDMVNHAGGEAELLLAGRSAPTHSAEWELAPGHGGTGGGTAGWRLAVTAAHDLAPGEEVLFDYGAGRPNADFLASYGFIPPRNPSESVALWEGVADAVAWMGGGGGGGGGVEAAAAAAAAAASPAERAGLASPDPDVRAEAGRLRLWAGGRADGRAVAALTAVAGGDAGAARAAVAARAAELLALAVRRGAPPLLPALKELGRAAEGAEDADGCCTSGVCEPSAVWTALGRRYAPLAPALADAGLADAAGTQPVPSTVAAPPGAGRAAWRRARLACLTAGAYQSMVLWDAVAGGLAAGGGGREAVAAAVRRVTGGVQQSR